MRIIFVGTVKFSLHSLMHLVALGANITGVVTSQKSEFNSDYADLTKFCLMNKIPYILTKDINAIESISWIKEKKPDVIFCFGWSSLFNEDILSIPSKGVIGFHPTELPKNRGRHPIIWALVLGLNETASTFFFMKKGADTGNILSQEKISISEEDDAGSLYEKLQKTALVQIESFLPKLESGSVDSVYQDESISNLWRKRSVRDGCIDWRMSAKSIHNLVRGLSKPYLGAHFIFEGDDLRVWKTSLVCNVPSNIEPGKVLYLSNEGPVIKCGEQAICLVITEPKFEPKIGEYL